MLVTALVTALSVAEVMAPSTRRVKSVAVIPLESFAQIGEMNVRQRQRHFLATHAGKAHVNLGTRHQEIIHFDFPGRFPARLCRGVRGSRAAAFGYGVDVVHDLAEVVLAKGIAFEGDFSRFGAHRTHDDFVR